MSGEEPMKIEEVGAEDSVDPKEDLTAAESLSLGDSYFVDEDFGQAVDAYAAALAVLRDNDGALKIRILSHRSAAFYRIGHYRDALDDALEALEVLGEKGSNIAGLRAGETEVCHKRAGVAAMNLQEYQKAKAMFEKAQELASLNKRDSKVYSSYIRQCDYNLKPKRDPAPEMPPSPPAAVASTPAPAPVAPTSASAPVAGSNKSSTATSTGPKSTAPAKSAGPKIVTGSSRSKPKPEPESNTKKMPVTGMPKYQYYQNDKFMTIAILESNVKPEDLNVQFERKHLTVDLMKGGTNYHVISANLFDEIDVDNSKVNIKDEKVLVKLRKTEAHEWKELLGKKTTPKTTSEKSVSGGESDTAGDGGEDAKPPDDVMDIPTVETNKPRPYASHRDWDKIEKELENQEKKETPEGDDAMNKLFQQIYAGADEDTRRAMIKSYQTSGGTVLSTNWGEVKEKDYEKERTAPKGMEWKNWEGEKLPMEDDD